MGGGDLAAEVFAAVIGVSVLLGAGLCAIQSSTPSAAQSVATPATKFVSVPPSRLFDTRPEEGAAGPKGFVSAGRSIDVQVRGVAGVPNTALAVVVNLTATAAGGAGFVTAWPTGAVRPLASNLNLDFAGQTVPNFVVVTIGSGGRISIFTSGGAHFLADVTGYFRPYVTPGDTGCEGLDSFTPVRAFDSRPGEPAPGPKGFVPGDGSVDVQITGLAVRSSGAIMTIGTNATAVLATFTATSAGGAGFVTAWPAGGTRPLTSVVNLDGPGHTAANLAIIPIGALGRISLYTSSGAHLIVDVAGYFGDAGCFVALKAFFAPDAPFRILDTRAGTTAPAPVTRGNGVLPAETQIAYRYGNSDDPVETRPATHGLPSGGFPTALVNVTMIEANPGFVTAWGSPFARPNASTLNITRNGEVRAGVALTGTTFIFGLTPPGSPTGASIFTQGGGHLAIDVLGQFATNIA